MELAAHWHKCQNLPKKRVNTLLLYRERDDPVKERLANWRTRSGTLGSVEERYTGALHGRTSKILAIWQIDSYPRQADAYLCLKRAIYRRFEHKIGRISCPTFRGKIMSQIGFRAKLCVRETAFGSSIQAHWTGDFMSLKWRIYGLSDKRLFAPAGVLPTRPNTTPIHVSARVNSAMRPSAAIQATGPAEGRKPMSSATPVTRTMVIIVRIKLPRTCPVSTEAR